MRVTLAQKKHEIGEKEKNLKIIEKTAEEEKDTDLLIFPEMFLTGYCLRDRLWYDSEKIPGLSSREISRAAVENETNIICGMPERVKTDGRLRNTALLATSDGELHRYRKTYLPNFGPFQDKRYFQADDDIPVFETPVGKIGMLICYDIFFPELAKTMAQKGVEIIAVISASPSTTRTYFEKVITTRAIETTSYLFYSNLVGREENMYFWGGATAISPKGEIIGKGKYFEEDLVKSEIELDALSNARRNRPVLNDTRKEIMNADRLIS
ncbi:MAG: carbon-nitrogen hydrolase family protein [Candidatus Thermoplasmatota archaeon]|nr:carbon-nitrogen hydrolase family protein [Candidatus Thermoplasmatota archaeon]MBS3790624.1 carbon-nitrogen hydrolase family protein [Candidatus Thermoplasmatota archaeon]